MCLRSLHIEDILWNYIQAILGLLCLSHHNLKLMAGKVGCLVYLVALLVCCLGGSVLKSDLAGAVKKKKGDFRFCIGSDAWRAFFCFRFTTIKDSLSLLR